MEENTKSLDETLEKMNEQKKSADTVQKTVEEMNAEMAMINARIERIRTLWEAQGINGVWNSCQYMCGVFNGLEMAMAVLENRNIQYRDILKEQMR